MRARVLSVLAVAVLIAAPAVVLAGDPPHEQTGAPALATTLAVAPTARIHEIRAPLLAMPAITTHDASFRLELEIPDGAALVEVGLTDRSARPSLLSGVIGGSPCGATWSDLGRGASLLWADTPGLSVRHFEVTVRTQVGDTRYPCAPGLYDLWIVAHDPATNKDVFDVQLGAVSVMDPARHAALAAGTAEPRFVVIADPQVGDPRAFQTGMEESFAEQSAAPFGERVDGLAGDGSSGENGRWKAYRQAFKAIAEEKPDFILVAGDLGFGQLVPGSYSVEYEEIWRLLTESPAPVYASPGNHDGYVASGQDGFAYWRAYVGPTYFVTGTVPGTTLLSMNTYDWSEMDRIGLSLGVSSWGGQVRETQLAWIDASLAAVRAAKPDERVITLSHHSPSWRQDPYFDADPSGTTERAHGLPVLEQASRGAVSFGTTDQAWSGENRLELRDLLREHGVEVAFAGHTHRDRVARDDGVGRIVETHQDAYGMPAEYDPRDLHYFARDDGLIRGHSQAALGAILKTADAPLYVETTTVMSGSSQYWGYRSVEIAYTPAGDLELRKFGYAITAEELEALAADPALFNPAHVEFGLFSTPLRLAVGAPWSALPGSS